MAHQKNTSLGTGTPRVVANSASNLLWAFHKAPFQPPTSVVCDLWNAHAGK